VEEKDDVSLESAERIKVDRKKGIARNTLIVTALRALSPLSGTLREMVMSRLMGTTAAADIYRFAIERIVQDIYTKIEKLLQPTYLPVFVGRQTLDGEERAWRFTSIIGTLLALFLVVVAAAGTLWAPQIAGFFLRYLHEQPGNLSLAVFMLRLTIPFLVFYCLSNLLELTLQSYANFTLPAVAEALRRLVLVGVLIVVALLFHPLSERQAVVALGFGAILGILLRLFVQVPALRQQLRYLRPAIDLSNPDVRKALILTGPLWVGVAFAFARNLVEAALAGSFGEGSLAALGFARKLIDMPWQMLAVSLSYVIYPFISELGATKQREQLSTALVSTVRVLAFIFIPLMVAMLILADPITSVLYQGGKFTEESKALTLSAFLYYIPGLVFFAIEDPVMKWFYALSDTKTPTVLGILSDALYFAVVFPGVFIFRAELPALALGMVLSKAIKVCIVLIILRLRLGSSGWENICIFGGKLIGASAGVGAVLWVLSHLLGWIVGWGFARGGMVGFAVGGVYLLTLGGIGILLFAALSWLLRIDEWMLVVERVRNRFRRKLTDSSST